jgi:hypothetical protein
MSRRSWIKPSIRKAIADAAIRNPKEPRELLYARVKRDIEASGEVPPADETGYKIISQARRNPPKFTQLWTMASLKEDTFPPESIPALLKVWRYSINTGEKFSVAQAEWVSRIYTLFNNVSLLWYWSHRYAYEERLSTAVNGVMDTFLIDSNLVLKKWEIDTLLKSDFREGKLIKYKIDRFLPISENGDIIVELLHGIEQYSPWGGEDRFNERDLKLARLIRKLPTLSTLGMEEETKMVYLRLFKHMTKGPDWNKISPEEALKLIENLRDWVLKEQEHILPGVPREQPLQMAEELKGFDFLKSIIFPFPIDLLERVGYRYKMTEEEKQKEEEYLQRLSTEQEEEE